MRDLEVSKAADSLSLMFVSGACFRIEVEILGTIQRVQLMLKAWCRKGRMHGEAVSGLKELVREVLLLEELQKR